MGKLIVVSGQNGSGKSLFAENIVSRYLLKRYYIATMIPRTAQNHERIAKHQKQRESLGFTTFEAPYSTAECAIDENSVVLIEDVSNLLANNIFDKGKNEEDVAKDILNLVKRCYATVAVTISNLRNTGHDTETTMYIDSLNRINEMLKKEASVCIEMSDGKPVYEKGESYDIC